MSKYTCKRWGQEVRFLRRQEALAFCEGSRKSQYGYRKNFPECQDCAAYKRLKNKGILPINFKLLAVGSLQRKAFVKKYEARL